MLSFRKSKAFKKEIVLDFSIASSPSLGIEKDIKRQLDKYDIRSYQNVGVL